MPICIHPTGTLIHHEKFGDGIILGNPHNRQVYNKQMMFYHVYYLEHNTFGYAAKFNIIQTADDTTTKQAQNILLNTIKPNGTSRFILGDIIEHPKHGKGIILGNGHKRAGQQYYHIYYHKSQTFGYNATFAYVTNATEETKQQAKELLFNNTIIPAFNE